MLGRTNNNNNSNSNESKVVGGNGNVNSRSQSPKFFNHHNKVAANTFSYSSLMNGLNPIAKGRRQQPQQPGQPQPELFNYGGRSESLSSYSRDSTVVQTPSPVLETAGLPYEVEEQEEDLDLEEGTVYSKGSSVGSNNYGKQSIKRERRKNTLRHRDSWDVGLNVVDYSVYQNAGKPSKETLQMISESLEAFKSKDRKSSALKARNMSDLTADLLNLATADENTPYIPKYVSFMENPVTASYSLDDYYRSQTTRKLLNMVENTGNDVEDDVIVPSSVSRVKEEEGAIRSSIDSVNSMDFADIEEEVTAKPRHKDSLEKLKLDKVPRKSSGKKEELNSANTINSDDEGDVWYEAERKGEGEGEAEGEMEVVEVEGESLAGIEEKDPLPQAAAPIVPVSSLRRTRHFMRADSSNSQNLDFVLQSEHKRSESSASESDDNSSPTVNLGTKARSSLDIFKLRPLIRGLFHPSASSSSSPRNSYEIATTSAASSNLNRNGSSSSRGFQLYTRISGRPVESTHLKESFSQSRVGTTTIHIDEGSSEEGAGTVSIQGASSRSSSESKGIRGFFKRFSMSSRRSGEEEMSSSNSNPTAGGKTKKVKGFKKFLSKVFPNFFAKYSSSK